MNEIYWKAFKTQQFYSTHTKNYIAQEKGKTFKETVSFQLASYYSNYLNQMNFHIFYLYFRFTSRALTSLIMPEGITGKSGPEHWAIKASAIYLQI